VQRPQQRLAAVRLAQEVEAEGGRIAVHGLQVGDRRLRGGVGHRRDREGGIAEPARLRLAPDALGQRRGLGRLVRPLRVSDDLHAGVAREDALRREVLVELGQRDVAGAAEEPVDAVEDVAVGADAALERVGDLGGAPVQPLGLGA
jgi:hypothetical protein